MKISKGRKHLLTYCLSASIALHIAMVCFLYLNPMHFHKSSLSALFKPSPQELDISKEDEELLTLKMEKALEDSLNRSIFLRDNPNFQELLLNEEKEKEGYIKKVEFIPPKKKLFSDPPKIASQELSLSKTNADFCTSMPPLFDPELQEELSEFALFEEWESSPLTYPVEQYGSIDFSEESLGWEKEFAKKSLEDDYNIEKKQFSPEPLHPHNLLALSPDFFTSLKEIDAPTARKSPSEMSEEQMFTNLNESTTPKMVLPNSVEYLRSQWIKRSLAKHQLPDIEYYGLDNIATSLEWGEDLDIDVALMSTPDGNRYIFSLTIQPQFAVEYCSMRQNFYFVIDRSSSINRSKFSRFKRAMQRSLTALRDGDNFNIYIIDKKVDRLSDRILPVTEKTLELAENFLEYQNPKTHFAAAEILKTLDQVLPRVYEPNEIHSVILITDGNTLLRSSRQRQILEKWAQQYKGIVNFYTAAAGKGNNLLLLDMISHITGGKMLYSDTNTGFPRKLVQLIKNLHHPIAQNLSIDIDPKDSGAKLALYPSKHPLSPMFAGQPYRLVGTIDELCDLTLYMQARNEDKWLHIRKDIKLEQSARNTRSLEKIWAHTQSKLCYDQFLINGNNRHLQEAVEIVTPHRGIIALEQ